MFATALRSSADISPPRPPIQTPNISWIASCGGSAGPAGDPRFRRQLAPGCDHCESPQGARHLGVGVCEPV